MNIPLVIAVAAGLIITMPFWIVGVLGLWNWLDDFFDDSPVEGPSCTLHPLEDPQWHPGCPTDPAEWNHHKYRGLRS
jgi:hypothetical protein